jgi:hypothetical protein
MEVGMYALLLASLLAQAQPQQPQQLQCGPASHVRESLRRDYGETPKGAGQAQGVVLEILAGPKGTWTLLAHRPDGISCILASGERWGMKVDLET